VRMLHDREIAVRGLARDVSDLPEGVDRVGADVRDIDALRAAVRDIDAVLLVWPFMAADGVGQVAGSSSFIVGPCLALIDHGPAELG
jgi:uncharacterized protein YbjT (DUF2867 family)